MWSLWKLFHPIKQWLKRSEPINWALFSKAKPFRSPRLISLNSFRNVAAHREVFAPFLFIGFDLQNEYLFFPVFSVAASLSFTLSCSDSQLRIVRFLIARASGASESNTNLAMHLGALAQWISRLLACVRPIIKAMPCGLVSEVHSAFLRAVELQSSDCRRTSSATERMLG